MSLVSDLDGDTLLPVVVLTEGEDALTVVPLSPTVELASEWDLRLPETLLGYPVIAQVWNHGTVLPEQAIECVATVPIPDLDALQRLVRAASASANPPEGLRVGPPVVDDQDPRLLFQDAQAELAHSFWEPTLALAGAATLGQLVHHRREELQIPAGDIERLSQPHGWLTGLENDTLDLLRALPSSALAATMRVLRITASQRLARILKWTIEARRPTAGTALARNASDRQTQPGVDVDEYIQDFLRDLQGDEP
ncbi:MAG: hypothetical protein ABSH36_05690 [Solirubrobacteraceae bacterium]